MHKSYLLKFVHAYSPRLYNRSAVVSMIQTHDPPIVSHTKLTSRLRCIPLPNSYIYCIYIYICYTYLKL